MIFLLGMRPHDHDTRRRYTRTHYKFYFTHRKLNPVLLPYTPISFMKKIKYKKRSLEDMMLPPHNNKARTSLAIKPLIQVTRRAENISSITKTRENIFKKCQVDKKPYQKGVSEARIKSKNKAVRKLFHLSPRPAVFRKFLGNYQQSIIRKTTLPQQSDTLSFISHFA